MSALHLLTLGVLVTTAMGASLQLLPIATRQPILRVWPARLSFWLYAPGTLVLAIGMIDASPNIMLAGATGVCAGIAIFAVLMTDNLLRGREHADCCRAWLGCTRCADRFRRIGHQPRDRLQHRFPVRSSDGRQRAYGAATFGFMGLLAFGFSHVLVPMFTISRALPARHGWLELVWRSRQSQSLFSVF